MPLFMLFDARMPTVQASEGQVKHDQSMQFPGHLQSKALLLLHSWHTDFTPNRRHFLWQSMEQHCRDV